MLIGWYRGYHWSIAVIAQANLIKIGLNLPESIMISLMVNIYFFSRASFFAWVMLYKYKILFSWIGRLLVHLRWQDTEMAWYEISQ